MISYSKIVLITWLVGWIMYALVWMRSTIAHLCMSDVPYKDLPHGRSCTKESLTIPVAISSFVFVWSVIALVAIVSQMKMAKNTLKVILGVVLFLVFGYVMFYMAVSPHKSPHHAWDDVYENRTSWHEDYPATFRSVAVNRRAWSVVEKCMKEVELCAYPDDITAKENPVLVKGCCSPPHRCGFIKNGSDPIWQVPENGPAKNDGECEKWLGITDGRCYSCDMCKASYLFVYHQQFVAAHHHYQDLGIFAFFTCIFIAIGGFKEDEQKL